MYFSKRKNRFFEAFACIGYFGFSVVSLAKSISWIFSQSLKSIKSVIYVSHILASRYVKHVFFKRHTGIQEILAICHWQVILLFLTQIVG